MWVKEQRKIKSHNKMLDEHVELLELLGFIWQFFKCRAEETWEQHYQRLTNFKEEFGHIRIPEKPKGKKWLGLKTWTIQQRAKHKKGLLSEWQISQLNVLDFCWDPYRAQWDEKYKLLVDYYQKHGSTKVENSDKENSSLRHWIAKQYTHKVRLAPDQVKLLDDLGFCMGRHQKKSFTKIQSPIQNRSFMDDKI